MKDDKSKKKPVTPPTGGAPPPPPSSPPGNYLISTPLGKKAGWLQAGNKPWLNVVMNIVFTILLLAGSWPFGLMAAGLDAPPLYTGGVWIGDNVESVNKTTFVVVGSIITAAAIGLMIWWNIYYRNKRLFYQAMTEEERKQVFL